MKFLSRTSYFYTLYEKINKNIIDFEYDIKNVKVNMIVTNKNEFNDISFLDESIQYYINKKFIYTYVFSHIGYSTKLYIGSTSQVKLPKEDYLLFYLI